MNRSLQIKLLIVLVLLGYAVVTLWPTLQLSRADESMEAQKRQELESNAIKLGLDLRGGMYLVLGFDDEQLAASSIDRDDAISRVMEILRNRIDQFGVSEPVIQREGDQRIVVQLPGLQDIQRAKNLIGSTARLEFRLVRESAEVAPLLTRVDRALMGTGASLDSTVADSLLSSADRPFSSLLRGFDPGFSALVVAEADLDAVKALLAQEGVQRVLPRDAGFLFGKEVYDRGGIATRNLFLVENKVLLEGGEIQNAFVEPDQDPTRPGALQVGLELSKRGGLVFGNVTGANVGRKLAIVLDEVVQSAPVVRSKITGGRASISGGFDVDEEARDLALMLRAGALPVDVKIEEERTVGPSLGRDSIRAGVNAGMIGGVLVILFLLVYYRASGALATAGLVVTMGLLLAVLARLGLTLTLPGIAGMILTIGMAVDANVLIFERIREELRAGKTVRAAIHAGFSNATRAIVDSNVTTIIAGVVLWYFGTGPIRGFAVTLTIGIFTSMFSALVFSRAIYELWLGNRSPKSLSI